MCLIIVILVTGCIGPTPVYMLSNADEFRPLEKHKCVEDGISKIARIVSRKILNNGDGEEYIYQTKGSAFSKRVAVYERKSTKTRIFHGANFPYSIGVNGLMEEKKSMSLVSESISDECGVSLSKF